MFNSLGVLLLLGRRIRQQSLLAKGVIPLFPPKKYPEYDKKSISSSEGPFLKLWRVLNNPFITITLGIGLDPNNGSNTSACKWLVWVENTCYHLSQCKIVFKIVTCRYNK